MRCRPRERESARFGVRVMASIDRRSQYQQLTLTKGSFRHPLHVAALVQNASCVFTSAAQQRAAQRMCERPLTLLLLTVIILLNRIFFHFAQTNRHYCKPEPKVNIQKTTQNFLG